MITAAQNLVLNYLPIPAGDLATLASMTEVRCYACE